MVVVIFNSVQSVQETFPRLDPHKDEFSYTIGKMLEDVEIATKEERITELTNRGMCRNVEAREHRVY